VSVAQIGPVYVPPSASAPEVIPALPQLSTLPPRPAFAGFWLRAIACSIDTILIVGIFMVGAAFFPAAFEKLLPPATASLMDLPQPPPLMIALLVILSCLYNTVFEASSWQATPGKRILKLYVTDLRAQRLTFGRALLRNLARQISGFFFIGYLVAGFTEKKQALHDLLAGCLVLRKR
jgi:uncharacterized RDD family membrane protein YckC